MDAAAQAAMYSVVTTAVHLSLLFSYFFLAAVAIPDAVVAYSAATVVAALVAATAVHLSSLFFYFFLAVVAIPAEMTDMIVDVTETIAVV